MPAKQKYPTSAERYPSRRVTDENFAHCLDLFPAIRAWGRMVKPGRRISFNDINHVLLPMEMLEAFVQHHAGGEGPLAEECRRVLADIERFQKFFEAKDGEPESADAA